VVETMSFQARPFYESRGYQLVGSHGGLHGGHLNHLLVKHLGPSP
jgi:hypothetical protein